MSFENPVFRNGYGTQRGVVPNAKGPAQLKDAIEEMCALENFLP
jgi:hypothetical protein